MNGVLDPNANRIAGAKIQAPHVKSCSREARKVVKTNRSGSSHTIPGSYTDCYSRSGFLRGSSNIRRVCSTYVSRSSYRATHVGRRLVPRGQHRAAHTMQMHTENTLHSIRASLIVVLLSAAVQNNLHLIRRRCGTPAQRPWNQEQRSLRHAPHPSSTPINNHLAPYPRCTQPRQQMPPLP